MEWRAWWCMCVCLFMKQGFVGITRLANGVGRQHGALSGEQLISGSRWEHGECVSRIQRQPTRSALFPLCPIRAPNWSLPSMFSVHPANRWHLNLWQTLPPLSRSFRSPWQRRVAWLLRPEGISQNRKPSSSGSFTVRIPHFHCDTWTIGMWGGLSLRWKWDFCALITMQRRVCMSSRGHSQIQMCVSLA